MVHSRMQAVSLAPVNFQLLLPLPRSPFSPACLFDCILCFFQFTSLIIAAVMNKLVRLVKFSLLFLVLFAAYLGRDRWLYERLLRSLYITFDDFPADYVEALEANVAGDLSLQEYSYSTYPDNNSDATIPAIVSCNTGNA